MIDFQKKPKTLICTLSFIKLEQLNSLVKKISLQVLPETEEGSSTVDEEALMELRETETNASYKDVKVNKDLTESQKQEAVSLLESFTDLFTTKPGKTNLESHQIQLTTDEPIRVRPYTVPYSQRKVIQDEVQAMLREDIIEPSNSPYSSPIVLVKKKDGSNRFCIDFRKLNAATVFDTEPMGDIQDSLAKLGQSKFFTKIDLCKGYWQIPLEESAKPITAFTTIDGCYQFKRMPFGLVNSGATFNRMMRKLLGGTVKVDNYVDNILVNTSSWEELLIVLRDVLTRIKNAGLTIKPSKCQVGFEEIEYLGHKIGSGRVTTDEDKTCKVSNAERPQTKKQVRSFMGLANYYWKFIPSFAEIAVPLTDLTKKGEPNKVNWGEAQEKSFQTLKTLLTKSPILHLPDFNRSFIVRADASDVGVGAILLQDFDDGIFPISYASKKLSKTETNYSVIERECAALVFAVKKFQKYLYGKEFMLQTDHKPLAYLQSAKSENSRLLRWALFLQNYKFKIEAIKGADNVGADYLSRQNPS